MNPLTESKQFTNLFRLCPLCAVKWVSSCRKMCLHTSLHAVDRTAPSSSSDDDRQYTAPIFYVMWCCSIYNREQPCLGSKMFFGTVVDKCGHRDRVDEAYRIPSSHPCSPCSCKLYHHLAPVYTAVVKKQHGCNEGLWIDEFHSCYPPHRIQRCPFFIDGTRSAFYVFLHCKMETTISNKLVNKHQLLQR